MKHKRHPEAQLEIADSPFPKPTSFCWPIDLRQWFFCWGSFQCQNFEENRPFRVILPTTQQHRSRPFALVHLGSGNTPNPRGLQHCSMASGRPLQASLSKNSIEQPNSAFFININRSSTFEKSWKHCEPSVICWVPIHPPHEPASLTGFWVTTNAHLLFLAFVDLSCTIVAWLDDMYCKKSIGANPLLAWISIFLRCDRDWYSAQFVASGT